MTARRKILRKDQAQEMLDMLRDDYGINLQSVSIDIGPDHVKVTPPAQAPGNDFDAWKNQNRDKAASR